MKRLISILAAILIVSTQIVAEEQRDNMSLLECILNEGFSIHAKTNEICYISFGSQVAINSGGQTYIDPPDEFLKRFADRPFIVRKASESPKFGKSKNLRSFDKNPETGVPDGIYTAEIVEWIDDKTARVKFSMHRAILWARGYEAIAEKRDGKWRIKKHVLDWVS